MRKMCILGIPVLIYLLNYYSSPIPNTCAETLRWDPSLNSKYILIHFDRKTIINENLNTIQNSLMILG